MRSPWSRRTPEDAPEAQDAPKKSKSFGAQVVELVVIVGVALGLALLIQAFLVKPYRIPSGSMEPTLKIGQRVLVDRIGNNFGNPSIGDVLVFHPPVGAGADSTPTCGNKAVEASEAKGYQNTACSVAIGKEDTSTNYIKRLVAGPGDTIYLDNGHVFRRPKGAATFKREPDSYIEGCQGGDTCTLRKPITIPPGHYFMMGDNRGASDDSRFWGSIPRSWIIGKAFLTYWPVGRVGFL